MYYQVEGRVGVIFQISVAVLETILNCAVDAAVTDNKI